MARRLEEDDDDRPDPASRITYIISDKPEAIAERYYRGHSRLTTTKLIFACTRNIETLSSPAPLTLYRNNEWKDTESAERTDDARQTRVIVIFDTLYNNTWRSQITRDIAL